jgi:hypothetical protein
MLKLEEVPAGPRRELERLIAERGEDYSSLSRLLGRNAAYIQQFIKRGTPHKLGEEDRRTLARYFGVGESLLGGPDRRDEPPLVEVAAFAVRASAGAGWKHAPRPSASMPTGSSA